jgi:hypothetical protein
MGNVTGRAPFNFHRRVLEDEWSLLIDMAGETDGILGRRRSHLVRPNGAVDVVAVHALHQAFIHAMVKWHLELGLLLQMAGVTKVRLRFRQEKLFRPRMMRRVAGDTADVILAVDRVDCVHVLHAARMARQTAGVDFFRGSILEQDILVLSPPPATWSAPGPWQPSQPWCEGPAFVSRVVFQCGVFSQLL